jgi:hypothetical protein
VGPVGWGGCGGVDGGNCRPGTTGCGRWKASGMLVKYWSNLLLVEMFLSSRGAALVPNFEFTGMQSRFFLLVICCRPLRINRNKMGSFEANANFMPCGYSLSMFKT